MEYTTEDIVMELVVNSGNARSKAMEAIFKAKDGKFSTAESLLEEAKNDINKSHDFQTQLISAEAGGQKVDMNLIMVHGQDHLMNAMVVIDLAEEFVNLYKKVE